ncbi:SH3 and cysteine-rich domain-containing protein isoform X1 [Lycorma delicatula]|uniref:SH3 and cysteine-rich domain-containing protein isoform X1 n=1 Tax=Lycorma delicatula TaxID=130591 RepID=UPI003F51932B
MYVIFPAEDVVEFTLRRPTYTVTAVQNCQEPDRSGGTPENQKGKKSSTKKSKSVKQNNSSNKSKKNKLVSFLSKSSSVSSNEMASGSSGECMLKDLTHPSLNDHLKNHNAVTFKLVRTVSDFTQELSQMYEQHAEELQLLVTNFRKKNAELRKERPSCPSSLFHTWETLLQEVEVDSQAHSDIASVFGRQVSRPLLERSFHRKVQARKVFAHRENFEVFITKAEDKLAKCRQEYKTAYLLQMNSPNSTATLATYLDAHNNYVTQLHATNGMVDQYYHETLPQLLQELEDVYIDLCSTLSDSVLQGAEVISMRASEQAKRYEGLSSQCRTVLPPQDLSHFVRSLSPLPPHPHPTHRLRLFTPPQPPQPPDQPDGPEASSIVYNDANLPPPLKNEIVIDRLASIQIRQKYESLRIEAMELETQIKQLQDALDTMLRIQQRSLESQLYNKVNELQEDISLKKFDLRQAQIHLSSVKAQKELFGGKLESAEGAGGRDRKMSSSSTGSMKTKWLKAFKSLKTTSGPSNGTTTKDSSEKKNGRDGGMNLSGDNTAHQFQEYTYKKITPCDVCSQVLRGHTRQGLKCRICKMNVHIDCQEKVGRCQAKSRLLRRQKSTSEIETRVTPAQEEEALSLTVGRSGRWSVSPGTSPRTVTWKNPPSNSPSSSRILAAAASDLQSPREPPSGETDAVYQVLRTAGEMSSVNRPDRDYPDRADRERDRDGGINRSVSIRGGPEPPVQPCNSGRRIQQPSLMLRGPTSLSVGPPPSASSSDFGVASALPPAEVIRRRRLFGGIRSFSMFGSRSAHHAHSISLPEKQSNYAAGTRPFGQPLVLGGVQENGDEQSPSPSAINKQRGGTIKKRT